MNIPDNSITDIKKAVRILLDQKPLAIFQGESEWGLRALGNRSMLFDPRNKDAQNIVNKLKGRELWRPLAGTILVEHVDEYFDLGNLKESPYMSYAVKAKDKAIKETPAIVHVDGTCRIQTLKRKDNPHYYDLIKEFYNHTKVPILLNTSLNPSGKPIMEELWKARILVDFSLYLPS
jgi:carbamoyltransferase